jgi:hypothetical protein
MRPEEKYRIKKQIEREYKNRVCVVCGKKEGDIEDFGEGEIYEFETTESEFLGKYLMCDACFEDIQGEWIGF